MCTALRLSTIWILLALICKSVSALLVYDRQTLLDIRASHTLCKGQNTCEDYSDHPFLSDIPEYLRRAPLDLVCPRRRPRKRGKRGGALVRRRAFLRARRGSSQEGSVYLSGGLPPCPTQRQRWIYPVDLTGETAPTWLPAPASVEYFPRLLRSAGRGVDHGNLRSLAYTRPPGNNADLILQMALINARSVANKSFF